MPATRRRSTARKSAKAVSTPVIKSTTPTANRPEKPNLSLEDYKADFKVRWQIHTYEVNELASDIKKAYEFASPYVTKAVKFTTETYKNLQTRFATVD